jgi:hypothetical protein
MGQGLLPICLPMIFALGSGGVMLAIFGHSSSGSSRNPWQSTTLPSCVIGT